MIILELKNTLVKMKFSPVGINSRSELNEERISELEDGSIQFIQSEEQRGKKSKINLSKPQRPLCHYQAYQPMCNGVSQWERRERKGRNKYLKKQWLKTSQTLLKNIYQWI